MAPVRATGIHCLSAVICHLLAGFPDCSVFRASERQKGAMCAVCIRRNVLHGNSSQSK